jgi:hypothetical protein
MPKKTAGEHPWFANRRRAFRKTEWREYKDDETPVGKAATHRNRSDDIMAKGDIKAYRAWRRKK